jgi:hypothetical protein
MAPYLRSRTGPADNDSVKKKFQELMKKVFQLALEKFEEANYGGSSRIPKFSLAIFIFYYSVYFGAL